MEPQFDMKLKEISIFLIAALGSISIAANAEPGNACEGLGMGKEVQMQFPGYRIAVCLRGMGPTHMVVISESSNSSDYSVKTLPLKPVATHTCHECSPNVGLSADVYAFYKAEDDGVAYRVDIQKDASASLLITSGGTRVYSDRTTEVYYGDLIRP